MADYFSACMSLCPICVSSKFCQSHCSRDWLPSRNDATYCFQSKHSCNNFTLCTKLQKRSRGVDGNRQRSSHCESCSLRPQCAFRLAARNSLLRPLVAIRLNYAHSTIGILASLICACGNYAPTQGLVVLSDAPADWLVLRLWQWTSTVCSFASRMLSTRT